MNTSTCNPIIDSYFADLASRLTDLPPGARQDLLLELRAHVMDRLELLATPTEEDCRTVLKLLGTPGDIARQYRMELLLKRPSWTISPLTVLRTSLRWTVAGVQGYAVFVAALLGYVLSACFFVTAALKPLFPRHIGVFLSEQGLQIARFPAPPSGQEVLGHYYIPMAILVGYLFALSTTLLIRFLLRHGRVLRRRLA